MKKRVAMYYSGAQWQLDLFQFDKYRTLIDRLVYAPQLSDEALAPFDVLVVPRESNQELLHLRSEVVRRFLAGGGTVVSFGEIVRPWLSDISWRSGAPRFVYDGKNAWDKGYLDNKPMTITVPEHPAFRGLEIDDLTWHFHGALVPPRGATTLLRYGAAQTIALEHHPVGGGRIFAATLDPILHAGYGVVKKTQRFLDAVLRWARDESSDRIALAVGATESGALWGDHFGVAPFYFLFDRNGALIEKRRNPHGGANGGKAAHHGNPQLIVDLLPECSVWIGRQIGEGGEKRRRIVEQAGIEIVSSEAREAEAAAREYLAANKETV